RRRPRTGARSPRADVGADGAGGLILLATPCFGFPLRGAEPSRTGAPSLAPTPGPHAPRWPVDRGRRHLSAPGRVGHRPPSRRPREPADLLARGCRPLRRRRPPPLRRARVPRIPDVRSARPRLRTGSVRELRVRAPRAVLVQATRLLSQLWRPPHGGAGRPPRRSRPAARSPAPVGAHPAAPPALSSCVQSCALPRGARRRRTRRARVLSPPRGAHGRARRRSGAVTVIQRFGGGLQLNVHFHT